MSDPVTLDDPLAEARRIVAEAARAGIQARLLGGLAFHAQVPSWTAVIDRPRRDLDMATRTGDRRALTDLLAASGYEADRHYNALHGGRQLYFTDRRTGRPLDVVIDRLEMCHSFEFTSRLDLDPLTLSRADLLLSKLQIVQINRKDLLDILILLREYELTSDDRAGINVERIVALTSNDWGWWRTVTGNLDRLVAFVDGDLRAHELETGAPVHHDLTAQLATLRANIDSGRKSIAWRVRARLGDHAPWYDEPEEVAHEPA